MKFFVIKNGTILRNEYYGGIIFNKNSGATMEVDHELFQVLRFLKKPRSIEEIKNQINSFSVKKRADLKIKFFLKKLAIHGFIKICHDSQRESKITNTGAKFIETNCKDCLSSPEVVHLSVTGRCNLDCPFCYEKYAEEEMTTSQIFYLIDRLSEMGVFQLAIGGGEPFMRKDMVEIIRYCTKRHIVPNVTTNGTLLSVDIMKKISGLVGQINISLNSHFIENRTFDIDKIRDLKNYRIKTGLNFLVTSRSIHVLEELLHLSSEMPVSNIVILRPKPTPWNKEWFEENKLTGKDMATLKDILVRFSKKIKVHIDCSLVFLMKDISRDLLQSNAIYGCVAGENFCTIKSNGDVFPCSFLNRKEYLAGNVLCDDFNAIWKNSLVFKNMRNIKNNVIGVCRNCSIKENCKGCRAIALFETGNLYSGERLCSEGQYENNRHKNPIRV